MCVAVIISKCQVKKGWGSRKKVYSNLFVRNHGYLHGKIIEEKKNLSMERDRAYLFWEKNKIEEMQVGNFQLRFKVIQNIRIISHLFFRDNNIEFTSRQVFACRKHLTIQVLQHSIYVSEMWVRIILI